MQRRLVLAPSLRLLWRQARATAEEGVASAGTTGRGASPILLNTIGARGAAFNGSSSVVARHALASAAPAASAAASGQRTSIPYDHRRRFSSAAASAASADAAPAPSPPDQQQQQQADAGVTLSDSAVARLLELQRRAGGKPVALRVEVEGGGCSGFQYVLRLEEGDAAAAPPAAGETAFERGGARLLVDDVSLGLLRGAVVDFEDTLMRSAFHVASNPNSEASCGCGSSFAAKGP